MDFESPDVEKDFPGLYASQSESGRRSEQSDYSDDSHDKPKNQLLIGKKKKKDKDKDKGYAALEGESSAEEGEMDMKSPSKTKKPKSFKFPSTKKDKKDKKDKEAKEQEKEEKKKEKKEKEGKVKLKLKDKKKAKHTDIGTAGSAQPIFGVPLHVAVERSRCHDGIELPAIVRECIDYTEEHGLSQEGLYRSSGVKSKVQQLRRAYNQGEQVCLYDYEPPIVASLLKQFLRELPEPVLTSELMPRFEEISALKDNAKREDGLKTLLTELPSCNRLLLSWVFVHMGHVIQREKQNKMNVQNVSIVLSPTMQISHRVLNSLFIHSKALFQGVSIKKYVPPISSSSVELPEKPAAIEEELQKQESLLNQIHEEMNAGNVSKKREEQLWEVQRVITQLKRKLRMAKRAEEAVLKTANTEAKLSSSQEDEFRIDLTLQTARSSGEPAQSEQEEKEDVAPDNAEKCRLEEVDPKGESKSYRICSSAEGRDEERKEEEVDNKVTVSVKVEKEVHVVQVHVADVREETCTESGMDSRERESNAKETKIKEREEVDSKEEMVGRSQVMEQGHVTVIRIGGSDEVATAEVVPEADSDSEQKTDENVTESAEEDPELQELIAEELQLRLEQEELMNIGSELKRRVQSEWREVDRLKVEIAEMQTLYHYHAYSVGSSDNSSISDSEDSENEEELEQKLGRILKENQELEHKNAALCRHIHNEREACMRLRVQIRLLQMKDSKQL